jgi:(S)-2-hydroxyglutarate dehydrogenase
MMAGVDPKMKIVPFRGEYYKLKESKSHLVNNLIYPVPDPQFPFLGVHLTRMINGEIHVGPNAVLAFKREGYKKTDLNVNDLLEILSYPAFWKIAKQHLKYGLGEMHRSVSKQKFLESLQRLVPAIEKEDLVTTEAGVRAKALTIDGKLVDDFMIIKSKRSIHVCNAPSPAATASMAIGEEIVTYIDSLLVI